MRLIDCERWPEKDFSDDRSHFTMYRYKGKLPISYLYKYSKYFICIRPDYLGLDYKEYREDFKIIDYFNGVKEREFDSDKFQQCCEYIYQKYLEGNKDIEPPTL